MDLPENTLLPFFVYGVFQPGELGFLRLKEYVTDAIPASAHGELRIRDGLPLLHLGPHGRVAGTLLTFRPESSGRAYYRIIELEPDAQYEWETARIETTQGVCAANVLIGRNLSNGSVAFEGTRWQGKDDPFFRDAFQVVEETLVDDAVPAPPDLRPLFRVQMGYLLLWAILERYAALRYHLAGDVLGKIEHLANEPAFAKALKMNVHQRREVYRADDPDPAKRCKLNPDNPKQSIRYYYQLRCNATHRGKAASQDFALLLNSSRELVKITKHVIDVAFREALWDSP